MTNECIDWRSVEALSFDCYGTLIDWEAGLVAASRPWRTRAQVAPQEALGMFARHETLVQDENPTWRYPRVLAQTMRRMGAEVGCEPLEDEVSQFSQSVADWPAFPDSRATLARLGERFQLVVLSNIDDQSLAASSARLGDPFDLSCTAEAIGSYKPNRRNFVYLLDRLKERGVSREHLVHVAQSRYHDIVPATRMGLHTVWVDRAGGGAVQGGGATPAPSEALRVEPSATVLSLAELVDQVWSGSS